MGIIFKPDESKEEKITKIAEELQISQNEARKIFKKMEDMEGYNKIEDIEKYLNK